MAAGRIGRQYSSACRHRAAQHGHVLDLCGGGAASEGGAAPRRVRAALREHATERAEAARGFSRTSSCARTSGSRACVHCISLTLSPQNYAYSGDAHKTKLCCAARTHSLCMYNAIALLLSFVDCQHRGCATKSQVDAEEAFCAVAVSSPCRSGRFAPIHAQSFVPRCGCCRRRFSKS